MNTQFSVFYTKYTCLYTDWYIFRNRYNNIYYYNTVNAVYINKKAAFMYFSSYLKFCLHTPRNCSNIQLLEQNHSYHECKCYCSYCIAGETEKWKTSNMQAFKQLIQRESLIPQQGSLACSSLFLQGLKIASEKEFVTNHTDYYLWEPVLILVFNPSLRGRRAG